MKRPWWAGVPLLRALYDRGYDDGYRWRGEQVRRGREMAAEEPPDVAPPDDLMDALESSVSPTMLRQIRARMASSDSARGEKK